VGKEKNREEKKIKRKKKNAPESFHSETLAGPIQCGPVFFG
jgi:hypothetical protein